MAPNHGLAHSSSWGLSEKVQSFQILLPLGLPYYRRSSILLTVGFHVCSHIQTHWNVQRVETPNPSPGSRKWLPFYLERHSLTSITPELGAWWCLVFQTFPAKSGRIWLMPPICPKGVWSQQVLGLCHYSYLIIYWTLLDGLWAGPIPFSSILTQNDLRILAGLCRTSGRSQEL